MDIDCILEILDICKKGTKPESAMGALQAVKHRALQYLAEVDRDLYHEVTSNEQGRD